MKDESIVWMLLTSVPVTDVAGEDALAAPGAGQLPRPALRGPAPGLVTPVAAVVLPVAPPAAMYTQAVTARQLLSGSSQTSVDSFNFNSNISGMDRTWARQVWLQTPSSDPSCTHLC